MSMQIERSSEEPAEPEIAIYDFLYRDSVRISSLYAQLFNGRLQTVVTSTTSGEESVKGGKVNAAVASGEMAHKKSLVSLRSETIDPHDVLILDLLDKIQDRGWLHSDLAGAANGNLVSVSGTVCFVDRSILTLADVAIEAAAAEARAKGAAGKAQSKLFETMRKLVTKLEMPSAYFLKTERGETVSGTIKETGLDEPISAYYFRHGGAGLSEVTVIGVKESDSGTEIQLKSPMGEMMAPLFGVFKQLLFPDDAFKVTPVLMFRTIRPA